jgi:hypothetical protein
MESLCGTNKKIKIEFSEKIGYNFRDIKFSFMDIILPIVEIIIAIVIFLFFAEKFLKQKIQSMEGRVILEYRKKLGKIPAFIEVLRRNGVDEEMYTELIQLHSDAVLSGKDDIYAILGHNDAIHRKFLFLMQISVRIPSLNSDEYFHYMRDYIVSYERNMKESLINVRKALQSYNAFIGRVFPWKHQLEIQI